ncbi:MAG: alanine racemase [Desulfobacterales bacterium]|nr:alanine racemase [Desulfobacterales bacterium]
MSQPTTQITEDTASCLTPQTRVVVDLSAFIHNLKTIRSQCAPQTRIMAVIKADAYGHGDVTIARAAEAHGADFLGVARITETQKLRRAGIGLPILLFGSISPNQVAYAASHDIRISIGDVETARTISQVAQTLPHAVKVHIKADTGMGRLGLSTADIETAAREALAISQLPGLDIEGLYTHFPCADEADKAPTLAQFDTFMALKDKMANLGLSPGICHCANSAATMTLPRTHLDMVRPGISLYGLSYNTDQPPEALGFKRAMSIVSEVIHIKTVPRGFSVSYGATHVTDKETTIATVPIGYGDGYPRLNSNTGIMLAGGKRARVIGRVCMDLTMIDTSHIPGLKVGDPVVIMGRQGNECLWAEELARLTRTLNYEVVASLTRRMPIHYIHTEEESREHAPERRLGTGPLAGPSH